MRQWLATVKYCMRKRDGLNDDIRLVIIFLFFLFIYCLMSIESYEIILCSIIGSIDGVLDSSVAHSSETLLSSPQSSTNHLDIIVNNDIGKYLL